MTRHVEMVLAVADNKAIGSDNGLPWPKLPADMHRFRSLTLGKTVVMGRATHESIGRLLPDRHNVVIGGSAPCDGAEWFTNIADALEKYPMCVVIGGAALCRSMLRHNLIDVAHITEVHGEFSGDVYFDISEFPNMQEVSRTEVGDTYPLSFVTYKRED